MGAGQRLHGMNALDIQQTPSRILGLLLDFLFEVASRRSRGFLVGHFFVIIELVEENQVATVPLPTLITID